jgi:hypothetical protein
MSEIIIAVTAQFIACATAAAISGPLNWKVLAFGALVYCPVFLFVNWVLGTKVKR